LGASHDKKVPAQNQSENHPVRCFASVAEDLGARRMGAKQL